MCSFKIQEIPVSPFRVKVDPSHDASKVKAEGPGLARAGLLLKGFDLIENLGLIGWLMSLVRFSHAASQVWRAENQHTSPFTPKELAKLLWTFSFPDLIKDSPSKTLRSLTTMTIPRLSSTPQFSRWGSAVASHRFKSSLKRLNGQTGHHSRFIFLHHNFGLLYQFRGRWW